MIILCTGVCLCCSILCTYCFYRFYKTYETLNEEQLRKIWEADLYEDKKH